MDNRCWLLQLWMSFRKTPDRLSGPAGLRDDRDATLAPIMRTARTRKSLLLVLIFITLCSVPVLAASSDSTPGTHTITASSSHNYVQFCVPPGMTVSNFREVSASPGSRYWIEYNGDIASNYYGDSGPVIRWEIRPVFPGADSNPSDLSPKGGCGIWEFYTDENTGPVTISYLLSNGGAGSSSGCAACDGMSGSGVSDPVKPTKEPEIPWVVVIGAAVAGAAVVGGAAIIRKGSGKNPAPPGGPPQKISPPPPLPQQPPQPDEKKPRIVRYILWISRNKLDLTAENCEFIDVIPRKELDDGTVVDAPEARVEITLEQSSILDHTTLSPSPYRHFFQVNQKKGSEAAFNKNTGVLSDPKEFDLELDEVVRITARAGTSQVSTDVRVNIKLSRWFQLCFGVKFEWMTNPVDLKEETHLRTNYATVLKGFRDAIEKYNATPPQRAHLGFKAKSDTQRTSAGLFLFGHSSPERIEDQYYFTTSEELRGILRKKDDYSKPLGPVSQTPPPKKKENSIQTWIEGTSTDKNPPWDTPYGTEASLAVKILAPGRILQGAGGTKQISPGEVFYLSLVETQGDIGAALLLAHNTLRSFARIGSNARTGVNPMNTPTFRSVFTTIRGGFRIIDGAPGTPKVNYPQQNFAEDFSGPWYHLFGTAFYEMYTVGTNQSPEGWGQAANKAEQWYREWWSWEAPDPEKYCVNLWGIAIADILLQDQPWGDYTGKLSPKPEITIGGDGGILPADLDQGTDDH
ncbi:MAG: hypothetical protein WCJ93_04360 [Methanomicrobiales archaeon]